MFFSEPVCLRFILKMVLNDALQHALVIHSVTTIKDNLHNNFYYGKPAYPSARTGAR